MNDDVITKIPEYQCHKKVRAFKIEGITLGELGAYIRPENQFKLGLPDFFVSADYLNKHQPYTGGYYVLYEDGYESFSPAKAFEEGYTLIQ